jgi:uncharacterized membrane protein
MRRYAERTVVMAICFLSLGLFVLVRMIVHA